MSTSWTSFINRKEQFRDNLTSAEGPKRIVLVLRALAPGPIAMAESCFAWVLILGRFADSLSASRFRVVYRGVCRGAADAAAPRRMNTM
jgi:hypothetical protein